MPAAVPIITSFNGGLLSPRMSGRVDIDKWRTSCQVLENFIPLPQGPAEFRPGFGFIAATKTSSKASILVPFIFSDEQAYMLEFGDKYIRFYKDQGQIVDGGSPYEIVTPYAAADLAGLKYTQSADVMYLVHPDYPPMKLSRFGHTNWTIEVIAFNDGPYLPINRDLGLYITPSATTGNGITLTAEYLQRYKDFGTYSDTLSGTADVFAAANMHAGFRFQMPADGYINSVKVNISSAAGSSVNVAAWIWQDVSGSPGGTGASSDDTFDPSVTGEKTLTFGYREIYKTAGTWLWVVFEPDFAASSAAKMDCVVDNASYGSGTDTTVVGITDNLGKDFRVNINYQSADTPVVAIWDANSVGALWRLRQSGQTVDKKFTAADQATDTLYLRGKFYVDMTSDPSAPWSGKVTLQKSYNDGGDWKDVHAFFYTTNQDFFEPKGNVLYRLYVSNYDSGKIIGTIYQPDHHGVVKIASFVSGHEVTADVIHDLASTTEPTSEWHEGAWSDFQGWPKSVAFFEDRLVFGGTQKSPQTTWLSWVGDYENFMPSDTDDAPLSFTIQSGQVNAIEWIIAHRDIVIGTSAAEWRLGGQKQTEPITGKNVRANRETTKGSSPAVMPIMIGSSILFLQKSGRKLRKLEYAFESDSWKAPDMTLLADDITSGGIVSLAYQQDPDDLVWAVRADGVLLCLTYYTDQQVYGWSPHTTDGVFESIATIPSAFGADESHDELWAIVQRTVNGSTVRYVELMASNYDADSPADYFHVDSGLTYSGAAASVISGLDHLEGKTVAVSADGAYHPPCIVESGQITLNSSYTTVHAGLGYTGKLQPMSIEAGVVDGTAQTRRKRIREVAIRFILTATGKVGPDESNLNVIAFRGTDAVFGTTPDLYSGDIVMPFPSGWGRSLAPMIIQDQSLPMTVAAIIPRVETNA